MRSGLLATIVLLALAGLGGCPNGGTGFNLPSDTTGGTTDTTTGGTSTSTATDSFADGLSQTYPTCQESAVGDDYRAQVLTLVNEARVNAGVSALTVNETLAQQATEYACEMIHYDFFAHENPVTGTTLADRSQEFGYEYGWIGENLAAGQRTPAEVVQAWLDSPCHRKNLLHPAFTEIGIGLRVGGDYGIYWVQEFGRPTSAGPYTGPDFEVEGCNE